jgi:hypothetical protein
VEETQGGKEGESRKTVIERRNQLGNLSHSRVIPFSGKLHNVDCDGLRHSMVVRDWSSPRGCDETHKGIHTEGSQEESGLVFSMVCFPCPYFTSYPHPGSLALTLLDINRVMFL